MATILDDVLMLEFKVPMAVNMKATVFSNVMPYDALVNGNNLADGTS
jgi:hypothetical protein